MADTPLPITLGKTMDGYLLNVGITKRELFAALSMQGLLSGVSVGVGAKDAAFQTAAAVYAVAAADALITALQK